DRSRLVRRARRAARALRRRPFPTASKMGRPSPFPATPGRDARASRGGTAIARLTLEVDVERMVPGAMLAREAEARVLASARSGAVAIPELLSEILYFEQVRLSTQGENARTKDDLRFIAAVRQDLVEARPEDAWRLFERW